MMSRRTKIFCLVLSITFFIVALIVRPDKSLDNLFETITITGTIVTIIILIFYNFLWKLPYFLKLNKLINISGRWISTIDGENDESILIECKVVQNFDRVKFTFLSNNFKSKSVISNLSYELDGQYVYFTYVTTKKKNKSEYKPHYGTMILKCGVDSLNGIYYDSLGNRNEITFIKQKSA